MSNLQFYIPQSLSAIQKGPKFEQDKYSILNYFFHKYIKAHKWNHSSCRNETFSKVQVWKSSLFNFLFCAVQNRGHLLMCLIHDWIPSYLVKSYIKLLLPMTGTKNILDRETDWKGKPHKLRAYIILLKLLSFLPLY